MDSKLYQNGEMVDNGMMFDSFKVYPNPYVVYSSDGMFTKHYFAEDQRVASKLGNAGNLFTNRQATPSNKKEGNDPQLNAENDFKNYLSKTGFEKTEVEKEFAKGPAPMGGVYYLHGDHLGTATYVTNEIAEPTQFFLNLPFGETMVEQQEPTAYVNPYKFNAKELDSETGLYYYGARYYNPRISIWYGVDPLAIYNPVMETQFYGDGQHNGGVYYFGNNNPYIYTYQNPIKYVDPNGKQVDIVITNKTVGTGDIRLIGGEDYEDAPATVKIDLYLMTVSDRATKKVSNYYVTRDAPVATGTDDDWFSDNETFVENQAFEPKDKVGNYKAVPLAYPEGTDLEALALRNSDGSSQLLTDSQRPGENQGSASGVMIHVGGKFKKRDGTTRVTGSLGCFGVNTGNSAIKGFIKDVTDRQKKNKNKTINISVQKRDNVDWNYVVGSDGKKTSKGL